MIFYKLGSSFLEMSCDEFEEYARIVISSLLRRYQYFAKIDQQKGILRENQLKRKEFEIQKINERCHIVEL